MKYTDVIASSSAPPLKMPRAQTLSFPRFVISGGNLP